MSASCRFAVAIHVLAVIAREEEGATSARIADSVNTNPVTIRRLLGALREAGIIETQKGAGLGSKLARPARRVTLAQIFRAVELGETFPLPESKPNARCPVGANIQAALAPVFNAAQAAMEQTLKKKTLADILRRVETRS